MIELTWIEQVINGDLSSLKHQTWLRHLALTQQNNINYERVNRIHQIEPQYSLKYVYKTLQILNNDDIEPKLKDIVKTVLIWSEVAKTGLSHVRTKWIQRGYNLAIHNIGSAQIFRELNPNHPNRKLIETLIETHGLIGQSLRGEVRFDLNLPLRRLMDEGFVEASDLRDILTALNHAIISAVSEPLWQSLESKVLKAINDMIHNHWSGLGTLDRVKQLRQTAIRSGEDVDQAIDEAAFSVFEQVFERFGLWYVEAALNEFSFTEFTNLFQWVLIQIGNSDIKHISFERLMVNIYYDHHGQKKINLYKKRMIENALHAYQQGKQPSNMHVTLVVDINPQDQIAWVDFQFSMASLKLIEFCELSEQADLMYEKAVLMLFDYFGLRKDAFDRFHNEGTYLQTMNQAIEHKAIILDYLVGTHIVDIGPGGGALMDMIERYNPKLSITGIDISTNVIEALMKKKHLEQHHWAVIQGDALNLSQYLKPKSVDTIIFSSIIHELFSYIEYAGTKFNIEVIRLALQSAFQVLKPKGRIIIRDGIMTEPKDTKRIIQFRTAEGLRFLENYVRDFKGRKIQYDIIGHQEVKMPVNDAMEFLYTYTWGEDSYIHEVNEQFGYFTPNEYIAFVHQLFKEQAQIITFKHYLQPGYRVALETKVTLLDTNHHPVEFPDSTCFMVIEKQ